MLIDSGASCNVIDRGTFHQLGGESLRKCNTRVYPLGAKAPIPLAGEADLIVQLNGKTRRVIFIVIDASCRTILGRATSLQFDMLQMGPSNKAALAATLSTQNQEDNHLPNNLRLQNILTE